MSRISALTRLQNLDLEGDEKDKRLRQIDSQLAVDPAVVAALAARDEDQKSLNGLRATLRERELEAKGVDARIREAELRLYGGRVGNPKELEGLEKELGMLKRQRSHLDDQLLDLMEAVDQAQKSYGASAETATRAEGKRAGDVETLTREREALATRMAELAAEREQVRASLDADALRVYDRLRRKAGYALSSIRRDACSACGVAVPTGLVQRVRAGDEFVYCSGCGRVLAS